MPLALKFHPNIAPIYGTGVVVHGTDMLDFMRLKDTELEKDTYFCFLLHNYKPSGGSLPLSRCSSETLEKILGHLERNNFNLWKDQFLESSTCRSDSMSELEELRSYYVEGLRQALEIRKEELAQASAKELIFWQVKRMFMTRLWGMLHEYDHDKRTVKLLSSGHLRTGKNYILKKYVEELLVVA